MLTQRIGTINLEKLKKEDSKERIFYDLFVPNDDGRTYKGEW